MASYNFKSVGKTQQQTNSEKLAVKKTPTPIGIKTPLQINYTGSGEIFTTHYNLIDTVKDNLRNLILTNWGERLGIYDFGANLRPLLTELVSDEDFDSKAIERISSAVGRWMPYVSLENYVSTIGHDKNNNSIAHISMTITYSIPTLNLSMGMLQINMNAS